MQPSVTSANISCVAQKEVDRCPSRYQPGKDEYLSIIRQVADSLIQVASMKRHPALITLSREHHDGLVIAQVLKSDVPAYRGMPDRPADRLEYFKARFVTALKPHFISEEQVPVPDAERTRRRRRRRLNRLVQEHRELEAATRLAAGDPSWNPGWMLPVDSWNGTFAQKNGNYSNGLRNTYPKASCRRLRRMSAGADQRLIISLRAWDPEDHSANTV